MQPVEIFKDQTRHHSRRPRAVQDDLVRERLAVPDLRRHDPSGNRKVPLGRPTFFPFPFILPFIFSALVRRPRRDGISPAYNNPLISPFLGRHVGSGTLPVTMLRWCRQPSPSKATLALFLFATGTGSSGRGGHHVHLNSSIGRASEVVASVTRLNWTMKSAAVAASAASKITRASGLPSSPRNSWTLTVFGIFGCLNRRVASSHCPGRTFSCVTKSMGSLEAAQGPALYNDAGPATDRRRRSPRSEGGGHGSDGTGPPGSRGSFQTTAAARRR